MGGAAGLVPGAGTERKTFRVNPPADHRGAPSSAQSEHAPAL
jgi:hypothetical protein